MKGRGDREEASCREHKVRCNMKDKEEMMMCRNNHGPASTERSMLPPIESRGNT
jgi:hypothetical protein